MKKIRALLKELPKTEIHLHLEALASVDTIWQLMNRHNLEYPDIKSKDDLRKKFQVTSLTEFIDVYINIILNCIRNIEDIDLLFRDAKDYLKRNNIVYAEIFFAPSMLVQNGLSFKELIDKLDEGVAYIKKAASRDIRFIIDVSRSFGPENAMNNVKNTITYKSENVLGIGLGGNEEQGPAIEYKEVFAEARKNGLVVVAHAGEDVGPKSIWDAINELGVSRIGHGISAIQDEKLMADLAERQIPLEICPTSNLFTRKYVDKLENHPIRPFFEKGIYVTVNTDDPTLFDIDLIDEYASLYEAGMFTVPELVTLIKNNLYATFLDESQKDAIWESCEKILKKRKVLV